MSLNVLNAKLDFWIKNNKNVLFVGKHGVGKTAMVKDAFERHNLNWRYFSASTMDPWVDFIGVPREKTEDKLPEQFEIVKELAKIDIAMAREYIELNWKLSNTNARKVVEYTLDKKEGVTFLDLVRPQTFAAGEVEALFFDEYNRSPKKVRNAVMELIQFKSINGMKFPNLRIVWAAINPDDDENQTYDVERLDPAQADRYHITVEVPYKPNADWFRQKYGHRTANAALQWWEELPDEEKDRISPRRLQYALDVFEEKGDMRDVLPFTANVSKLSAALNTGPITDKLEELLQSKDAGEARTFLQNENNYTSAMKYIVKSEKLMSYFLPLLSKEKMSALLNEDDKICNYIIHNSDKVPVFESVCREVLKANTNKRIVTKIRRTLTENQNLADVFASEAKNTISPDSKYQGKGNPNDWQKHLEDIMLLPQDNAQQKIVVFDKIVNNFPSRQTPSQALCVLEIFDSLFKDSFADALKTKGFDKAFGIINTCIDIIAIDINPNVGIIDIDVLKRHGKHFKNLLEKIKELGLIDRVHLPKASK